MPPVPPLGGGASAHRPAIGEVFSLRGGETIYVDTPADQRGPKIELRFASVASDSRCPRLVMCVVAGDATIVVTAAIGGSAAQISLRTTPAQGEGGGLPGYALRLIGLDPLRDHPEDSLELGQYTARLVVTTAGAGAPMATPVAATPEITVDACTLVEAGMVANLFGELLAPPLSRPTADGQGQTCLIKAARATIDIRMLPGGAAAAASLTDELRQAGVPLGPFADDPLGRSAFGQSGPQAALLLQADSYTLAFAVTFGGQAQAKDRDAAESNLATLQSIAIVRYAAGQTEDVR
jgi:hypothetical protein